MLRCGDRARVSLEQFRQGLSCSKPFSTALNCSNFTMSPPQGMGSRPSTSGTNEERPASSNAWPEETEEEKLSRGKSDGRTSLVPH